MPELPELTVWARQFRRELSGKRIAAVETRQPKCLNAPPAEVAAFLEGRTVRDARERGKWLVVDLDPDGYLLLNLGMGGDFLYRPTRAGATDPADPTNQAEPQNAAEPADPAEPTPSSGPPQAAPREPQFKLIFSDGAELGLRFWWFGYVHTVPAGQLDRHRMTASLGPSPLDPDMDLARFRRMVAARPRRTVKSFLMDQKVLAGIGNVYVQDSLWGARLHPDRSLGSLGPGEVEALWNSVRDVLQRAIAKGGLAYESDLYGRKGGFNGDDFAVGYKPGRPCPRCGTPIEKIKTGQTSTYVCPECQEPPE